MWTESRILSLYMWFLKYLVCQLFKMIIRTIIISSLFRTSSLILWLSNCLKFEIFIRRRRLFRLSFQLCSTEQNYPHYTKITKRWFYFILRSPQIYGYVNYEVIFVWLLNRPLPNQEVNECLAETIWMIVIKVSGLNLHFRQTLIWWYYLVFWNQGF